MGNQRAAFGCIQRGMQLTQPLRPGGQAVAGEIAAPALQRGGFPAGQARGGRGLPSGYRASRRPSQCQDDGERHRGADTPGPWIVQREHHRVILQQPAMRQQPDPHEPDRDSAGRHIQPARMVVQLRDGKASSATNRMIMICNAPMPAAAPKPSVSGQSSDLPAAPRQYATAGIARFHQFPMALRQREGEEEEESGEGDQPGRIRHIGNSTPSVRRMVNNAAMVRVSIRAMSFNAAEYSIDRLQ